MNLYSGNYLDQDLDDIKANCLAQKLPDDSYVIRAFLELIGEDEDALWALIKWNEFHEAHPKFLARAIVSLHEEGFNIYRVTPFFRRLGKYRIIYAFDGQHDEIHVLAVVLKKPDDLPEEIIEGYYGYERMHPITVRVCNEYDEIGIPKLR